ncbi:exported protein of unknown function [Bradyrhizobium sp. ORS 285]|uniref:hypothetical protein n=1 Tax=Bradyrhizobium sp. ORS 285 TaxID=115808 RepID=UPI0002409A00|nr:hypothetical protein [Bradyrhizobium sp. ORS 285]CCD85171.1 exported hypothetical protein [Bradyrhizobium sp. ORS 285]SMX58189.1 exported protein of unknown function [Bradyrhizobium sp. ORS 285]
MSDENESNLIQHNRRIIAGTCAAVALLVAGAVAFTWVSPVVPEKSVAQQWNEAISRLGIEPVYPPQEDIAVGDVFVILTKDELNEVEKEPLAGRSMRIWHVDMTSKIENAYAEIYRFPETPDAPAQGRAWKLGAANGPVFRPGVPRTDLPLVLFPGFTITSTRQANGAASAASLLGAAFHGDVASEFSMDVQIAAAETYGVPAIMAEAVLDSFCNGPLQRYCTETEARRQMSHVVGSKIYDKVTDPASGETKPRFSLELGLITRVYLARSFHNVIRRAGSAGGAVNGGDGGATPSKAPSDVPAAGGAQAGAATAAASPGEAGGRQTDPAGAIGPNSPGLSGALQFGNSSLVSTVQTLQRPVAFGFRSVRWQFGESK